MSMSTRLRQLINDSGMNIKEFCDVVDVPYKTMQNYLAGTRKIGIEALTSISLQIKVNTDWLLTGEGPMFRQQEADKPDQTPAPTEGSTTLDPKMTAVIKTVQMMPLEKQQEFIAETQKRAESIKQFLEMQERIERLEKEKCA